MADCDLLETCIFFNDNMPHMPNTSEMLKSDYCREKFYDCARFRVAAILGREQVPKDLFPDENNRADALIQSAQLP
jgi:hypothetical protein